MSKFNKARVRTAVSSPIRSDETPSGVTFEGAPGYKRDTKSELFLLAVSNMVSEDTFYEAAGERDKRFRDLVVAAAAEDPQWISGFLRWLRTDANMRSAPIVAAAELARAKPEGVRVRALVDAVLQRADEPGEILAYWLSRYGRPIPIALKRGVADAVYRLYDERALLKHDSREAGVRFGDVIELVQPRYHKRVHGTWRDDLYRYAIERRHDRGNEIPASLRVLRRHAELMASPVEARRDVLRRADVLDVLRGAGMTWESLAGWLQGPMDAEAWEAIIPSMGYMALLRNLRNFDEAGVSDEVAEKVAARLADPEQVTRSRQLPMRFLSAYRAAPSLRWGHALEKALSYSLANVPELAGRTLILVDRSGSMMWDRLSKRSDLTRADAAAIFGTALAMRCAEADLIQFGTGSEPVRVRRGESLLRVLDRFGDLGGTNTAEAVRRWYAGHDRVVIVTDEQARGADPTRAVPPTVPVYTWNLAGYTHGHGPSGEANRHTFGGLSDAAFRMIPLLEAGQNANWPWL